MYNSSHVFSEVHLILSKNGLQCSPPPWYFLDFSATRDSKVVVLTVNYLGNAQSYLDVVQNNVDLFRSIIPSVAHYNQNSILLVASQPGMAIFTFMIY